MPSAKWMREVQWTRERAALLAILSLTVGIGGGWAIRDFFTPPMQALASAPAGPSVASKIHEVPAQAAGVDHLKAAADAQAAPLLAQLQSGPASPELLSAIGNVYYDAQQYNIAVDYYNRALTSRPSDAAVRTDMGTAYWYLGNADRAIAEFDRALSEVPNNPNTLFNRGLVKWQAQHDAAGAASDWKKLLQTDPDYDQRDKVIQLLGQLPKQF